MRWQRFKGILVAVAVVVALWYLYPTLKFYTLPEEAKSRMSPEELAALGDKAVRLGLDLKGGMYLVLEVDLSKLRPEEQRDAVDRAMRIITNRVDQFGVAEPVIQRQGRDRIIVELPGLKDIDRATRLIGQTAQLEFKLLKPKEELEVVLRQIDRVLAKGHPEPEERAEELFEEAPEDTFLLAHPFTGLIFDVRGDLGVREEDVPKVKAMLADPEVQKVIPPDGEFLWSAKPEVVRGERYYPLYYVKKRPEMTGAMVKDARPDIGTGVDPKVAGRPIVHFFTTKDGVRLFSRITGANIGRRLAIVLDGKVYSAPVIETKITKGASMITGMGSMEEARDLAIVLRTGALPAPVKIINKQVVGPSLGADSIRQGVRAALIGLVLVVVFMAAYYRLCGLLADIALVLNLIFLMAALAGLHGTLTLPGIAGIILTIGMSVDANVLIFERIREELRQGRTVLRAISNGYSQAFRTILDANLTTLITAVVLYQFGTGPIRGFALTLSLGIIFSMFTAVVVTRVMLDAIVSRREVAQLSIGSSFLRKPKVQFVDLMRYVFLGSSSAIAAGLLFFVVQGPVYGIDFTGGTLLEGHFKDPVSVAEIRQVLSDVPFGDEKMDLADSEIKEFGSSNTFLIRFENPQGEVLTKAVRNRVKDAFGERLGEDWLRQEVDVGPKIGGELRGKAIKAILYSMLGILIYITWRFEFRFAVAAIIALFHDVLFTMGLLTILRQEFTMPVVAALLTIVGYSLNDTIVVFDRIREKLRTLRRVPFSEVVNIGINETLARTLITSLTTLIVVLALLLIGGTVIFGFALALTVGVFVGTYSSIFVASPILVAWRNWSERRGRQKGHMVRRR